jgi:hypothetical protein
MMLAPFVVVNGRTGKILRTGNCPERMVYLQEIAAHEVAFAEAADDQLHYYDIATAQRMDRPPMQAALSASTVPADGVSEVSLTGLPIPCVVRVEQTTYHVPDGRLDISFDLPGRYVLRVEAFPYLPAELEVTAT